MNGPGQNCADSERCGQVQPRVPQGVGSASTTQEVTPLFPWAERLDV